MLYIEKSYTDVGPLGFIVEKLGSNKFLCVASPSGFITTTSPATIPMNIQSVVGSVTTYDYNVNDQSFDTSAEYMIYFVDITKNITVETRPYDYLLYGSGLTLTVYLPSGTQTVYVSGEICSVQQSVSNNYVGPQRSTPGKIATGGVRSFLPIKYPK